MLVERSTAEYSILKCRTVEKEQVTEKGNKKTICKYNLCQNNGHLVIKSGTVLGL